MSQAPRSTPPHRKPSGPRRPSTPALRQHLADVTGLPTALSQTGKVQPSDFEAVANTALNDGAIIVNPAEADFDEIVGILKEVWA